MLNVKMYIQHLQYNVVFSQHMFEYYVTFCLQLFFVFVIACELALFKRDHRKIHWKSLSAIRVTSIVIISEALTVYGS